MIQHLAVVALLLCAVALWCAANAFDDLAREVHRLNHKENRIMATIDDVLAQLTELPTIADSLDALFVQLQALIAQGSTDPAKLQQALDLIVANKERVKAAIVANTPVAPVTP